MTKIPLRAYNREIEEAIDQKQIEEAIAHCQHILKTFPKHVDTYRLLGKAYLESQRFGNAADIFQRVLSSIPDDFISHVGMSIIREDEGNLDAAIWHMERAFESQSYNTAIQGELRRLYGQRDGMQPPKIRMTRGALARMYAKSDLYDQAIAEIRSTLAIDPLRPDLQVLLAKMYAKNWQPTQAIEVCSSLLQRLPYCLEANRLLTTLLSEDEHQDDIEIYKQRLQALDPYEALVSTTTPNADKVPDQAVTIMRLDWDGGPVILETADQPEWATTIGVSLDDREEEDETEVLPDWLMDSAEEQQEIEDDITPELMDDGDEELIPEWMKEAGWEPATGEFDESVSSFVFDEEDIDEDRETSEAEAAEIPEWLKDIAPKEPAIANEEVIEAIPSEAVSDELPDWLSEEVDGATDTIITWLDEKEKSEETPAKVESSFEQDLDQEEIEEEFTPETTMVSDTWDETEPDEDIPDWLQGVVPEPASMGEIITTPAEAILEGGDIETLPEDLLPEETSEMEAVGEVSDIPDWLQRLGPEVPVEKERSGITDWLKTLEGEIADQEEEQQPEMEAPQDLVFPDEEEPEPSFGPSTEGLPTDTYEEEEIPDWLLNLKEQADVSEEQPESLGVFPKDEMPEEIPGEEEEQVPEWIKSLEQETRESEAEIEKSKALSFDESFDDTAFEEAIDIPDWLKNFDDERKEAEPTVAIPSDELLEKTEEIEPEVIPEWLGHLEAEIKDAGIETQPVASVPDEGHYGTETEEIPEWLDTLEGEIAEVEIEPEPTVIYPAYDNLRDETEIAEFPEWLDSLEQDTEGDTKPTVVQPAVEITEEIEAAAPADVPEWLQGLIGEEPEPSLEDELDEVLELESEGELSEVPEWLQGLADEIPDQVESEMLETIISEKGPTTPLLDEEDASQDFEPLDEIPEWLLEPDSLESVGDLYELETPTDTEYPEWLAEISQQDEIKREKIETAETSVPEAETVSVDHPIEEIDFQDAEAAMAWLDALALEDSISDDALLSRPDEVAALYEEEVSGEVPAYIEPEAEEVVQAELGTLETLAEPEMVDEWKGAETFEEIVDIEGIDQVAEFVETEEAETIIEMGTPELDIPAPTEEEETPDFVFEDADDAMAWLEGLAVKQGVSEDELLTSPEDRSEIPPDWVKQEMMAEIEEEMEETPEKVEESEEIEAVVEIPDWLKEAIESEAVGVEVTDELEMEPEEEVGSEGISADLPEFLREAMEFDTEEFLIPSEEFEGVSVSEKEIQSQPSEAVAGEESRPEPTPDEILEWLQEAPEPEEAIETGEETKETALVETPEAFLEAEPITDESEKLEESLEIEPQEEAYQWLPAEVSAGPIEPVERLELNEAPLKQLERLPSLGFQGAQAIIAYREDHGPFEGLEDLLKVPGITQDTIDAIRPKVEVTLPSIPVSEVSAETIGETEEIKPTDKFHALQLEAGSEFAQGNTSAAIQKYNQLVKKGKRLEGVIEDLNNILTGDIPNEVYVEVLQTLGDAYMKADRLQEALDSYTKAEELIR